MPLTLHSMINCADFLNSRTQNFVYDGNSTIVAWADLFDQTLPAAPQVSVVAGLHETDIDNVPSARSDNGANQLIQMKLRTRALAGTDLQSFKHAISATTLATPSHNAEFVTCLNTIISKPLLILSQPM